MNWFPQLVSAYSFDSPDIVPMLIASVIAFGFGFAEYIWSFRLVRREGKAPFPSWQHPFMFAHDTTWAVMFFFAAQEYDYFWLFDMFVIAMIVWACLELYNMYRDVKDNRVEGFGFMYGDNVTVRQAVTSLVVQICAWWGIWNLLIHLMGPGCIMQTTVLTNIFMCIAPGILWHSRGSRQGSGMGIALIILGGTINTFLPVSMMYMAVPTAWDTPWYFICGIIISLIALRNTLYMHSLSPKKAVPGEKHPIR